MDLAFQFLDPQEFATFDNFPIPPSHYPIFKYFPSQFMALTTPNKDLQTFEQALIKKKIDVDLLKGVKNSIVDEYMKSVKHQESIIHAERSKNHELHQQQMLALQ